MSRFQDVKISRFQPEVIERCLHLPLGQIKSPNASIWTQDPVKVGFADEDQCQDQYQDHHKSDPFKVEEKSGES